MDSRQLDAGAIALGYLQAIGASLSCAYSAFYFTMLHTFWKYESVGDGDCALRALVLAAGTLLGAYLVATGLLLVAGVRKRVARYVLTYLVTGAVSTAALLAAWILCLVYEADVIPTMATFAALVVYWLWLDVVRRVYLNIRLGDTSNIVRQLHQQEIKPQKIIKLPGQRTAKPTSSATSASAGSSQGLSTEKMASTRKALG